MEDIEKQYEYYFTYDKPIPYMSKSVLERKEFLFKQINLLNSIEKKSEDINKLLKDYITEYENEKQVLYIYPVLMSNYFEFYYDINCLLLKKNKIPDPKVISMSFLDFLFYLIENDENGSQYSKMLSGILSLCFHINNNEIKYYKDNKNKVHLIINDIEYDKTDFNNIKQIICYQNMPDYDDGYINPDLEEAINEANEMKNQNQGKTTLERQLICVSKEYSYKIHELYDVTIRKFVQMLQVADAQLHYKIYKTGECSGMVSFKEPITHYMYVKDTKFNSITSYDSFKEKMKSVAK